MTIRNSHTQPARSIFVLTASSGMLLGVACWAVVAVQHGGSRAVAGQDPLTEQQEVKSNAPAAITEFTSNTKKQSVTSESDNNEWQRPESGGAPAWLVAGGDAEKRLWKVAASLEKTVMADYASVPLTKLASELSKQAGVSIVVNSTELDAFGVDADNPVSVQLAEKTTLREVLRIALAPLNLNYLVTESGLVITSIDHAVSEPLNRVYDLTYILPNASNCEAIMNLIQQTVEPDSWLANGGSSNLLPIGSCLVLSAPEGTHHEVGKLLHSLSAMNPANLRKAPPVPKYPQPHPGMGGGMGGGGMGGMGMEGMGGGMGGMGGGMFRPRTGNNAKHAVGAPGGGY